MTNHSDQNHTIIAPLVNVLCTERTIEALSDEPTYADTTLAMLFVLQLCIGAGRIAFYALGLSFLDDNVRRSHSPALIGTVLACSVWGAQFGTALGLLVGGATTLGWWLGWSVLAPVLFGLAVLAALFPRRLLKSVVRQAADNIVQEASSSQMSLANVGQQPLLLHQQQPPVIPLLADISFRSSLRRVFTNRVLMCNVLAATLAATAVVNYAAHETAYLRARFLVPTNETDLQWPSRLYTLLVRPIAVALAVQLAGLVIAKAKPRARSVAAWAAICGTIAIALWVAYVFIDCGHEGGVLGRVAGGYGNRLTRPYCSRSCVCDEDIEFTPVCPADSGLTFYSPCHAGCADVAAVNDAVRLYTNCTCGAAGPDRIELEADAVATIGACGAEDCQPWWIVYQVLTVVGAGVVASAWVGRVLVSLRAVLPQDRALALAMELTLVGLIVYGPGHFGYEAIAGEFLVRIKAEWKSLRNAYHFNICIDITCEYWSHIPGSPDTPTVCQLHSAATFPNALNIVSAALMLFAVFFDVLVYAFAKDVLLFGDDETGGQTNEIGNQAVPLHTFASNQPSGQDGKQARRGACMILVMLSIIKPMEIP